jgi:hypothetical protein
MGLDDEKLRSEFSLLKRLGEESVFGLVLHIKRSSNMLRKLCFSDVRAIVCVIVFTELFVTKSL